MNRSPLAYPLTRGIDGDSGGAADLQTDIMRFMAILGLCLVAIFALVQSLPIAPEALAIPVEQQSTSTTPPAEVPAQESEPVAIERKSAPQPVAAATKPQLDRPTTAKPAQQQVQLQRPKWVPKFVAKARTPAPAEIATPPAAALTLPPAADLATSTVADVPTPAVKPPNTPEADGFTLRFESDIALTRLVAAGQIGFFAIESGRAQRMSVSESRISFWGASAPNVFHQMESATVPRAVVDALARAGADPTTVEWGVTLPARLSDQLRRLTSDHSGGALVITADGDLNLDRS